jgi:WD40 repeat protein
MFASGSSDKTAKYFRCEPGYYNFISSTEMGANPITALEFSEDGRILYTAANDSLKMWNMGKHGLLLDTVESPWKGVQDLCLIDMTLTGIAWSAAGLSVWAYTSRPYTREKRPKEREEE